LAAQEVLEAEFSHVQDWMVIDDLRETNYAVAVVQPMSLLCEEISSTSSVVSLVIV